MAPHVMMEGTCSVLQSGKYRRALRGLQLFGDEELMFNQPSQSTVRADTEVRTWALGRARRGGRWRGFPGAQSESPKPYGW